MGGTKGKLRAGRRALKIDTGMYGKVSGLLVTAPRPDALLVLGHGAGAGMHHPFMESAAASLAARGISTLRYQFPYMERGGGGPNSRGVLTATVHAAVARGEKLAGGKVKLLAGGKSMGGRMTSLAASETGLPAVSGIVFFGFPLHAAGKATAERAEHLFRVHAPMLFLQGTRDRLADLEQLGPICRQLGPRATLHIVDGADHSFKVPAKQGRDLEAVLGELSDTVAGWARKL